MLPLESLKPPSGSPGRRCLHGQHVRVSDERALLRLTIHDDPGSGLFWSENRTSEPIIIYCAPYHIIISHTVVVLPAGAQLQLLLRALVSPPPSQTAAGRYHSFISSVLLLSTSKSSFLPVAFSYYPGCDQTGCCPRASASQQDRRVSVSCFYLNSLALSPSV